MLVVARKKLMLVLNTCKGVCKVTRIELYTKNNCPGCAMTKKQLTALGIEYVETNVELDPEALKKVKELGFNTVPVVLDRETGDIWSGFQPDKIKSLMK